MIYLCVNTKKIIKNCVSILIKLSLLRVLITLGILETRSLPVVMVKDNAGVPLWKGDSFPYETHPALRGGRMMLCTSSVSISQRWESVGQNSLFPDNNSNLTYVLEVFR